ncbi:MAG: HNH endonuclease [Puniceicoccales bacterium]|jgi:5-methylcytosine-specific restriction endonuclease McrA|nr:HNH endonuclease [Puniceicoccales bacterium]
MNKSTSPFCYPTHAYVRKHGPDGYKKWNDYRDWLRDEFDFRCVYCLLRETWGRKRANWVVEHLVPRMLAPELALKYENLVYSCASCNSAKSSKTVPDPCQYAYGNLVYVTKDGKIHARNKNKEGQKLIRIAALNEEDLIGPREKQIHLIRMYKKHEPERYIQYMKFPDVLPDLTSIKKPPRNSKPGSEKACRHYQKLRGELPEIYE